MNKKIFDDRWFVWAIVAIAVTGLTLWAVVWRANIEMESDSLANTVVLH
jgi:hypothetical protein